MMELCTVNMCWPWAECRKRLHRSSVAAGMVKRDLDAMVIVKLSILLVAGSWSLFDGVGTVSDSLRKVELFARVSTCVWKT
jgi:hypothetical protein